MKNSNELMTPTEFKIDDPKNPKYYKDVLNKLEDKLKNLNEVYTKLTQNFKKRPSHFFKNDKISDILELKSEIKVVEDSIKKYKLIDKLVNLTDEEKNTIAFISKYPELIELYSDVMANNLEDCFQEICYIDGDTNSVIKKNK